MQIEEFYCLQGGNYDEVLSRLPREDLIKKYLKMFSDAKDFARYRKAVETSDWRTAFEAIHNVKGNALNLGLTRLATSSGKVCEILRSGPPAENFGLADELVTGDFDEVINMISQID